jgi:hypothetical protein
LVIVAVVGAALPGAVVAGVVDPPAVVGAAELVPLGVHAAAASTSAAPSASWPLILVIRETSSMGRSWGRGPMWRGR